MTANEAASEIAKLQAQSVAAESEISRLKNAAADWRQSMTACAGTAKKKTECRAYKETQAQAALSQIPDKKSLVARNATLITDYRKLIDAEAQSTIKLADHGLSAQSAIIKADGEAKAVQEAAKINAEANAKAIEKQAEAQATAHSKTTDSNNQLKNIAVIAIVLVVIVIAGLTAKKFLAKKKKKA